MATTSRGNTCVLRTSDDLLICTGCGTQYGVTAASGKDSCAVCDDPRQFVPPKGQSFTTLAQMRGEYHNEWWQDEVNPKIWFCRTVPQFSVGERFEILQTATGNVMWDMIALLDQATVDKINALGGLKAIVVSHPHYFTTWADWSRTFRCPVFLGAPDEPWIQRRDAADADVRLLHETHTCILPEELDDVRAILAGGHFDGSLLLHWEQQLFVADTVLATPSGVNPAPGKPGVNSFTFMWSIANRIPMHPDAVVRIWETVKGLEFHTAFGAFKGQDVRTAGDEAARGTGGVKGRLLESAKIYVKSIGWEGHGILDEKV